jgi:antitoxin MazE
MQSSLRRIGNSTGLVLPKAILGQIGIEQGAVLDLVVDNGRLIATPVENQTRSGWDDAAMQISESKDRDTELWSGFGNEGDDALAW